MRTYPVVFAPEFVEQLESLYDYIAEEASSYIAARYTDAIVEYCESLSTFPHRGTQRDDVRPGLRFTHYKKRAVIAFAVDTDKVSIIGLFYGGRDYETMLNESD
ncbi:type II toxin-antitoxin system RelE/ParE family toxin [Cupriavidus nantongensis]|uniref:type II toxin-antitoxin system RelE/ParE family toxin n=1 Tax=Cupriavidus nantongensis TaxID=1796606 RepID=UPI0022453F80|nr:type II toxin-antitoxin system RelE/ParE family toxin [Cupriavidus nantongensis]